MSGAIRALQMQLGAAHLIVATTFLAAFGLVMLYSATARPAAEVAGGFVGRQTLALLAGTLAAAAIAYCPRGAIRYGGYTVWALSTLAIGLTFTALGREANHATRWLELGPFEVQPLELAKIGVVLAIAQWFAGREERIYDVRVSLLAPAFFVGVPAALLLGQPDFAGAALLVVFGGALVFAAGARASHLLAAAAVALPVLAVLAFQGYRGERIESWLDPFADPLGAGYQLIQSLIGFAAGGPFGTGLGAGIQKLYFLPEAHTDFILSVIAEEMGLAGVLFVLAGFAALGVASLAIAARARNLHGTLLATGMGLLLWLQAALNAAVAMGALPTTGATLPLFSYGRSSLIVSLVAVGLIANVARPRSSAQRGWR